MSDEDMLDDWYYGCSGYLCATSSTILIEGFSRKVGIGSVMMGRLYADGFYRSPVSAGFLEARALAKAG